MVYPRDRICYTFDFKATKTIINSIVSNNDRIYVGIQLPPPKLTHNKGLLSGKIKHEAPPLSLGES